MKCVLCQQRSARRECPGVHGSICAICCGEQREVTIECPLDCVYLQDAHRHELGKHEPPAEIPYAGHDVSNDFLREKEPFIGSLALRLLEYAMENRVAVDADLRAALDALIRTYQTASSGLVYETLPEGPLRVGLYRGLQDFIAKWREAETQRAGLSSLRDGDVLRSLVFLARLSLMHDNRRPRGKAFLTFLRHAFPGVAAREQQGLIVPGR